MYIHYIICHRRWHPNPVPPALPSGRRCVTVSCLLTSQFPPYPGSSPVPAVPRLVPGVSPAIPNIWCEHDSTPWNHITPLLFLSLSLTVFLAFPQYRSFWIDEFSYRFSSSCFFFLFILLSRHRRPIVSYTRIRIAEPDYAAVCLFTLY